MLVHIGAISYSGITQKGNIRLMQRRAPTHILMCMWCVCMCFEQISGDYLYCSILSGCSVERVCVC